MVKHCLLLIAIAHTCIAEELQLNFSQNDYDVKMDIAEVSWYNKSCYKTIEASFSPYNRTQRVCNSTFDLLRDMDSSMMINVQLYKFTSNEYRFLPVTFRANVCGEYMENSFGARDVLTVTSNLTPCNMKKGSYYIHNAIPDFSKFPPHMPRGSYKGVLQTSFHSTLCATVNVYTRVVDKPIDWKSIPKSRKH